MFVGRFIKGIIELRKLTKSLRKDKKIFDSDDYYKEINEIPLLNWWKCKDGDYTYLWKVKQNYIPSFFKTIYLSMFFQLEYVDNETLRKTTQVNYYTNLWLTTKDIKWKRKADTRQAEIETTKTESEFKLNELVKKVQIGLKLTWQIDPLKISAGYFFSLLNELRNGNNREENDN